jgi:hypothetical protein
MVPKDKIIEIFCLVDGFCTAYKSEVKKHQVGDGKAKRNRNFPSFDCFNFTSNTC